MLNKLIAAFILISAIFTMAPASAAADIPVLTWEKGLEHNLVLGGNGDISRWKISMVSGDGSSLPFRMSKRDARGFVYFSLNIPSDLSNGIYTVVSSGKGSQNKVLAGIRLVDQSTFNPVQIPTKLLIILLTLIFLLSSLSLLRMEKYERIEYIRSRPRLAPNSFVEPFYRFRVSVIEEIHKSLFKFKLIREGELLLKLSPTLWSLIPWAGLIVGGYIGLNGSMIDGVRTTPALIYFAVGLVGVFDPFSGFMAGIGFAFVEIISGNASSIRSIMSLIAITLGWFTPGIISSLFSDALRKDRYSPMLKKFIPELLGAGIGALIFFVSELLTNSFADHVGPIPTNGFVFPMILGVFTFIRIKFEIYINKDLHQTGENYQIRVLQLPRVLSPRSVLFGTLYFTGCVYVWTESINFSLITGLLVTFPMALLLVRFESPVIPFFARFERHIALETLCVALLAYGAFINIQDFPLDVTQKGKMFILSAVIILFIHGFYSSVYDTSSRSKKIEVMA
ncbi:hypothetical protein MCEMRE195_01012 [Candidatus Nanopelagicaceae bacterium]